jgi:uncharacterized protein (UPF0335 family)
MAEGQLAADQLRQFIERIEHLESERKSLASDIKDILQESKSAGFEPKIIRQIIKLRTMNDADRQEQEALVQVYLDALGERHEQPN